MKNIEKMKILLIDDSPESIELIKKILEKGGYENVQATISAGEALEIINHFPPDLVLLDIIMPEMDGFEFCKIFKAQAVTGNIPIIMLSGSFKDSDEALEKAFHAGAVDFIPKPVRRPEILARVKSVLSLKWANDSVRQELAKQNLLTERLQTALGFIDSIIETSLCAIVITDSSGCINRVNDAYLKIIDYDRDEVIGKYMVEMAPREPGLYETVLGEKIEFTQDYIDNAAEMIGVLFEKGAVPEFEGYTLRKDGKIVLTLENNVLIYNDQKEAVASASILQDITENKQKERERENLIFELKEALKKVKTLSGMFPICSSCKKIRDDKGYWNQIESYVRDHSEAEFSHSLCPDCVKKLYPDIAEELEKKNGGRA